MLSGTGVLTSAVPTPETRHGHLRQVRPRVEAAIVRVLEPSRDLVPGQFTLIPGRQALVEVGDPFGHGGRGGERDEGRVRVDRGPGGDPARLTGAGEADPARVDLRRSRRTWTAPTASAVSRLKMSRVTRAAPLRTRRRLACRTRRQRVPGHQARGGAGRRNRGAAPPRPVHPDHARVSAVTSGQLSVPRESRPRSGRWPRPHVVAAVDHLREPRGRSVAAAEAGRRPAPAGGPATRRPLPRPPARRNHRDDSP